MNTAKHWTFKMVKMAVLSYVYFITILKCLTKRKYKCLGPTLKFSDLQSGKCKKEKEKDKTKEKYLCFSLFPSVKWKFNKLITGYCSRGSWGHYRKGTTQTKPLPGL